MPEPNGNGRHWLTSNLSAIVMVGTTFAAIAGNWFVMGERIKDTEADLAAILSKQDAIADDLDDAKRDIATLTVRFENLRDLIAELRRQSGLKTPTPPL